MGRDLFKTVPPEILEAWLVDREDNGILRFMKEHGFMEGKRLPEEATYCYECGNKLFLELEFNRYYCYACKLWGYYGHMVCFSTVDKEKSIEEKVEELQIQVDFINHSVDKLYDMVSAILNTRR